MLIDALINAYSTAKARDWNKLYWAVDLHSTCLIPNYEKGIPTQFYLGAKETLKTMSERSDIVLIMYTCSHPGEIEEYLNMFSLFGINFKYVNINPEVPDNAYGYFKDKFYFNVLLDDKAGFNPNEDWQVIRKFLEEIPPLK